MALRKPLVWIGSAKKQYDTFPDDVQDRFGFELYLAEIGTVRSHAKVLCGFGNAGVIELRDDFDGDTYRCVYTARLTRHVYVLHAFQKKAKEGIVTPQRDMDLVRQRLRAAQEMDIAVTRTPQEREERDDHER